MPLPTTSTLFVATDPAIVTIVDRYLGLWCRRMAWRLRNWEQLVRPVQVLAKGTASFRPSPKDTLTTILGLLVRSLRQHHRIPTRSRAWGPTSLMDRTILTKQYRSDRLAPCRCFG